MKKNYYVHTKSDHEVHTGDCGHLPNPENRKYLGQFDNCKDAVNEAKSTYSDADGCYYCCNSCHKK